MTRIYHALSTSPNTRDIVGHRLETISTVQTFCLVLVKKQDIGIDRNGSSLPLFSIPSNLRIASNVAKFLE